MKLIPLKQKDLLNHTHTHDHTHTHIYIYICITKYFESR